MGETCVYSLSHKTHLNWLVRIGTNIYVSTKKRVTGKYFILHKTLGGHKERLKRESLKLSAIRVRVCGRCEAVVWFWEVYIVKTASGKQVWHHSNYNNKHG